MFSRCFEMTVEYNVGQILNAFTNSFQSPMHTPYPSILNPSLVSNANGPQEHVSCIQ